MNNLFLFGGITYLLGIISSYYQRFIQLLFVTIRIPIEKIEQVYWFIDKNKIWKFSLAESYPVEKRISSLPVIDSSLIIYKKIFFWLELSEKYLTAGGSSKEEIFSISVFRPFKKKLVSILLESEKEEKEQRKYVNTYIGISSWFQKLAILNKIRYNKEIIVDESTKNSINDVLSDFEFNKRDKSSVLLYGPPGNGKTSLIRYIATKFDSDIYIPILSPDMTNGSIIELFANIPFNKKAIIVLEDFDNVFNKRQPLNDDCKFSFDVFLNILDGLYSNLDNKMIVITANQIENIDVALKNRPSRIDYVIKLDNPNYAERVKIVKNINANINAEKIADMTQDKSAAIVVEIAKRNPKNEELEVKVKEILESFKD